jgi:geranyl-CoA carboxylase alpha subunit
MIRKLLIANRGEIAVRVITTAKRMGVATVAVYSDADATAPHVLAADQAERIGPPRASDSYLSIEALLAAAERSGADAVHPGYGFLSESAAFASACADAGLTFVGPSPEAIAAMGDKRRAKDIMIEAGVPCVPGWHSEGADDAALAAAAEELGLPLLIKASAGGGGRGMRIVTEADKIAAALTSARNEAEAGFGDGSLILEKVIDPARHVEVQVMGDSHGAVVHLGARDCSLQRRHQKVIEETPPPGLPAAMIEGLCAAAVTAAKAIDYVGAGTVEFLVGDGGFYFLEMNTRLQVEHPVTEMITNLDLVAWQLQIAAGGPLPLTQDAIAFSGHAMEARLYAEDPATLLPRTGTVLDWQPASGDGVRIDAGIATGSEIGIHYDPLLAKIVAHGPDRESARKRLAEAIGDTRLLGATTNKAYLLALLALPDFVAGKPTTALAANVKIAAAPDEETIALAAATVFRDSIDGEPDPWRSAGEARWPLVLDEGKRRHQVTVAMLSDGSYQVDSHMVNADDLPRAVRDGDTLWLDAGDGARAWQDITYAPAEPPTAGADGKVPAPIPGRVAKVAVSVGDTVAAGALLAIIESMKIEHAITAPVAGKVTRLAVAEGDQVAARAPLVEIEA